MQSVVIQRHGGQHLCQLHMWLRQCRYRGHLLVGLCQLLSLFCSLQWCPRHVRLLVVHLGRRWCRLNLYLLWAIILKTVCQTFITSLSVVLVYLVLVARLIWLVFGVGKQWCLSTAQNYELVEAQFMAMFGVVDDERSSALKLYSTKQREDQDLNYFIVDITLLANKAFPKDPLMANMRAKEAFLKGCKHRREAWVVINNGHCVTFAEATAEVQCLLEVYSVYEGQGENLQIHAFSQVPNASVQDSHSLGQFSPTRITSKFRREILRLCRRIM